MRSSKILRKLSQEICDIQEIAEIAPTVPTPVPKTPAGVLQVHNNTGSDTDIDELMMEKEGEDEESIDIPANTDTSIKSAGKGDLSAGKGDLSLKINPLDITGSDGKLDIEKVMSWSIPKIKKVKRDAPSSSADNHS